MNEFLKKRGVKLAIAVVLAAVIVGVSAGLAGGEAGFFRNAAGAVSAPFKKAVGAMADWLESIYGYIYEYDRLTEENASLRAQLAEAQEQAREAQEAVDENESLRNLLGLAEKHSDFDFEQARVVSRTSSNWSKTFTISKGSDSGLAVGDSVITEYGALAGQIIELGTSWATVRAITDIDISVGVLVGEAGNAAMAVGDYTLMSDDCLKLTYLTEGALPLTGDTVLTSGMGGVFPQGLVVGTVKSVNTEAGGQTSYAVIEPSCDLDTLSRVYVITDFTVSE